MRFLAPYIMRGRLQAVLVTALCGLLALLLMPLTWPLSWLSAASVGLVTLVHGPFEGLLNALGATVLVGLLGLVSFGNPQLALGFVLAVWLPCWLLAHIVRRGGSLVLGLLAGAALGVILVLGVHAVVGDPTHAWREYVSQDLLPAMHQAGLDAASQHEIKSRLISAAPILTGMLAAFMTLGWMVALLLARWWQAQLVKPEGFRLEFHQLRLGRSAALGTLLVVAVAVLVSGGVGTAALNVLMVLAVLFLMQGLAVIHAVVAHQRSAVGWLIVLYVVLLLVPHSILLVAAGGIADNWADFRRRIGARQD